MRFSEAMEETIRLRVPRQDKRMLVETARKHGQTLSELLRDSIAETARRLEA